VGCGASHPNAFSVRGAFRKGTTPTPLARGSIDHRTGELAPGSSNPGLER